MSMRNEKKMADAYNDLKQLSETDMDDLIEISNKLFKRNSEICDQFKNDTKGLKSIKKYKEIKSKAMAEVELNEKTISLIGQLIG